MLPVSGQGGAVAKQPAGREPLLLADLRWLHYRACHRHRRHHRRRRLRPHPHDFYVQIPDPTDRGGRPTERPLPPPSPSMPVRNANVSSHAMVGERASFFFPFAFSFVRCYFHDPLHYSLRVVRHSWQQLQNSG